MYGGIYPVLQQNGINAITIFVQASEGMYQAWFDQNAAWLVEMYSPGERLYVMDTQIVETLGKVAVEYVVTGQITTIPGEEQTTILTTEIVDISSTDGASYAKDVSGRRSTVNDNCKNVNYDHFINDIVDGTISDMNIFSDKTYMEATGNVDLCGNTGKTIVSGVDLVLRKREKMTLGITKEISDIKIKLADGNYLINQAENVGTKYIANIAGAQQLITLDEELIHGASVQITYKITITKEYTDSATVKLYDYLSKELYFTTKDLDGNDVNQSWHIATDSISINQVMKDNITNGERTVLESNEITIPAGDQTISEEIVLSKVISSTDAYEYENDVEIGWYTNNQGRRIFVENDIGAVPGSYEVGNNATREKDTASAQLLSIVPPFGTNWFDKVKTKNYALIF